MKRNGHQARGAILAAAMRLFAEKGYAGTSTRAICQAAGITKPVLYYHFRSKEHLYQELMIDSFGQFQKALLRASKVQGPLRQRLIRVVHEDLKSTLDDPLRVQFVFRMIFSPRGTAARIQRAGEHGAPARFSSPASFARESRPASCKGTPVILPPC